jgi:hypothetical protein
MSAMAHEKRLYVSFSEDVWTQLRAEAERSHRTVAGAIRHAVERHLAHRDDEP